MGITMAQDGGGPRSPIQETLSNRTRRRSITNRHSQGVLTIQKIEKCLVIKTLTKKPYNKEAFWHTMGSV